MHTAFREPDVLTIMVVRHEHRAETSVQITHEEGGLAVVIFDDWSPVPERDLGDMLGRVADLWVRTGPLAAASYMLGLGRRRPTKGRPRTV